MRSADKSYNSRLASHLSYAQTVDSIFAPGYRQFFFAPTQQVHIWSQSYWVFAISHHSTNKSVCRRCRTCRSIFVDHHLFFSSLASFWLVLNCVRLFNIVVLAHTFVWFCFLTYYCCILHTPTIIICREFFFLSAVCVFFCAALLLLLYFVCVANENMVSREWLNKKSFICILEKWCAPFDI